jgi:hypothetical protein
VQKEVEEEHVLQFYVQDVQTDPIETYPVGQLSKQEWSGLREYEGRQDKQYVDVVQL